MSPHDSSSVFLRYTKVRPGSAALEYASIAERAIENDRHKTKTLKYLGPVKPESDWERYRRIFQECREAMKKFSLTDLRIKPTLSFGVFHASTALTDRYGISAILKRCQCQLNIFQKCQSKVSKIAS
ncbi:MAG: hypothetical protein LVQ94_07175 [Thermoplasmatales archaeon]|nr:hypothetical protein [Thermoplasmatales archaeon]